MLQVIRSTVLDKIWTLILSYLIIFELLSYHILSYLALPLQETDKSCKKTNAGREDDVWGAKWIHWRHFHDWSRYWCKFSSDWTIISCKIASLPGGLYNKHTDIRLQSFILRPEFLLHQSNSVLPCGSIFYRQTDSVTHMQPYDTWLMYDTIILMPPLIYSGRGKEGEKTAEKRERQHLPWHQVIMSSYC